MIEPTTVALHAVHRTGMRLGATVVVQGCGPIGLLTLQCARANGAGRLIAVEPNAGRRAIALELGADLAVTPVRGPGGGRCRRRPRLRVRRAGRPPSRRPPTSPAEAARSTSLATRRTRPPSTRRMWLVKQLTVVGSLGYLHEEFAEAMALVLDGRVRLDPLHDATVALADLPGAIERLADDPSSAVKVLVDPRP